MLNSGDNHTWYILTAISFTRFCFSFSANTFFPTIFGFCSYSPCPYLHSTSTFVGTCWPFAPIWQLTTHLENRWKNIKIYIKVFLYKNRESISIFTRTTSFVARFCCFIIVSTFFSTILSLYGYFSFPYLDSASASFVTWGPFTPRGPLTIHLENRWKILI